MNFFNEFITKIAASADKEKELELIKKVQKNENDNLAWQQLRIRFKPLISKAIGGAMVSQSNLPRDMFDAAAMKEFKRSILNFNANSGYQPSTYIMGNVQKSLQKLKDHNMNESRFSAGLAGPDKTLHNTREILEREIGREPTDEELRVGAKRLFNKEIPLREIRRINNYKRNELSFNKSIGEDGVGENITFADVFNTSNTSGEDLWASQNQERKIEAALNNLPPLERKVFMEWKGLGEFSNRKAPSLAALALNNNLGSAWQAQKMIRDIQSKIERELK